MKICTKCKQRFELKYFGKSKYFKCGYRARCKACTKEDNAKHQKKRALWLKTVEGRKYSNAVGRRWRKNNPEKTLEMQKEYYYKHKKKYLLKKLVRNKTRADIREDKIKKRNSFEICYNSPTECHHEDYSSSDFIELCRRCHTFLHKQYKEKNILLT